MKKFLEIIKHIGSYVAYITLAIAILGHASEFLTKVSEEIEKMQPKEKR